MAHEILQWAACILLLFGIKLIGEKRVAGFYVASVAEAMWIAWGIHARAYGLVAMSVAIMCMYVRSIWLWRKPTDGTP